MAELQPMQFRRLTFDWRRSYILGVVNVTPDSFSDGGQHAKGAVAFAEELSAAGADLIDVGGESTRPGSQPVAAAEERRRVVPVVRALVQGGRCTISVDTYKAEVAEAALCEGAELVNDISGGELEPALLEVVARHRAAIILGHLRGTPLGMNERATYKDPVREVGDELARRVERAVEAGVERSRIWIDPGLGFSKTGAHNLALLRRLGELLDLGCPLVVGASRKSFLGQLTGRPVTEREFATAAANTAAILAGAHMVRVHDVRAQRDAVLVADAIRRAEGQASAAFAGGAP